MNVIRFVRKCLTDQAAAKRSAKLVARSLYGRYHWFVHPTKPLAYRLPDGGVLLLERHHAFTLCFWPGVHDYYEPDIVEALRFFLRPGHTFVDCGANIGYFSVQAGQLVGETGTVISIEANPDAYQLLLRNLEINSVGKAVNCAVTSTSCIVDLFVPPEGDVYSSLSLGGLVNGNKCMSYRVKGELLDDVLDRLELSQVDLIKIDVEGAEMDVLGSSPKLLSQFRPKIIVEYGTNTWPSFGATRSSLEQLANDYHYELRQFDASSKKLIPVPESVWSRRYTNLILIPN